MFIPHLAEVPVLLQLSVQAVDLGPKVLDQLARLSSPALVYIGNVTFYLESLAKGTSARRSRARPALHSTLAEVIL